MATRLSRRTYWDLPDDVINHCDSVNKLHKIQNDFLRHSSELQAMVHFFSYILSLLTCLLGTITNIVVIYMVGFILKERLSMIWFLNLAIADIMYVFFSPLNFVSALTREWPFGSLVCNLYNFFSSAHTYVTIFTITALNVCCALQVAKPTWHKNFISRRTCCYVCATIWIVAVFSSLPAIFFIDEMKLRDSKQCAFFHYDFISNYQLLKKYKDRGRYSQSDFTITSPPVYESSSILYNETIATSENISYAILTSVPNVTSYDVLNTALTASQNITSDDSTNLSSIEVQMGSLTNVLSTTTNYDSHARYIQGLCQVIWSEMIFFTKCLVFPLVVIGYIIPLCVIITSNIIIALKVRTNPKRKPSSLYRITVALVLVFFVTRTPVVIAQIIYLVSAQYENVEVMVDIMKNLPVLSSLAHVSSCLNPIVYVIFGKQILRVLKGSSGSGIQ